MAGDPTDGGAPVDEPRISSPSISAVIPVYRSALILPELHGRLVDALAAITDNFEVIYVEDGSPDGAWSVITDLARSDLRIRGLRMSRNYGQHNALLCGIRAARNDVIVTLDDDLQNPPEEIHRLVARLDSRVHVVYGKPAAERHGFWRDQASRISKLALQGAMGAETARNVSAFRAFHAWVRDAFENYRGPDVSIDVLLTWGTTGFDHVEVQHEPRLIGESSYTFRKLIAHAFNMMTGFSTLPLQVASVIGFIFTLFGVGVLTLVLASYVVNGAAVPGFAFLASIVAIFSGAQLFALGIIGEYLARIHFRTMDRPTYVVLESTTLSDDGHGSTDVVG
jgi:glycosyltransferase involved in cell wall biosynthesis